MLKDLYVKMSLPDAAARKSKNAFTFLRTSVDNSKQQQLGSKDTSGKLTAAETPGKQPRTIVLNESGIVDFKQTLRKYNGPDAKDRKHQSLYDLQVPATAPEGPFERQARGSRVDPETIEGKKTATVKDRARLRDLIKNIGGIEA